jgi:hypothetical protein
LNYRASPYAATDNSNGLRTEKTVQITHVWPRFSLGPERAQQIAADDMALDF